MDRIDADPPEDLGRAGAIVGKTVEHMLGADISAVAIASALLGAAMGLLSHAMGDEAILGILDRAAESVRSGELRE